MPLPIPSYEPRSPDQLRRHYEIEKTLAGRLRSASKAERRTLYGEVYDELFRRVPELRGLAEEAESRRRAVDLQVAALAPLLAADGVFLELGAGDCALSLRLAERVRRVVAVDASAEVAARPKLPANFELRVSDATTLELAPGSVDLAYSCHFLEHLHPDDARDHMSAVLRVLRPGGRYLCVTPNRLWGPHDVSRYFDDLPTGFHLREYSHGDLARLFLKAGFAEARIWDGLARPPRERRVWPYAWFEKGLDALPLKGRRPLMNALLGRRQPPPFRPLEQVQVLGGKAPGPGVG